MNKLIGNGSFSKVYFKKYNNTKCALKIIQKNMIIYLRMK